MLRDVGLTPDWEDLRRREQPLDSSCLKMTKRQKPGSHNKVQKRTRTSNWVQVLCCGSVMSNVMATQWTANTPGFPDFAIFQEFAQICPMSWWWSNHLILCRPARPSLDDITSLHSLTYSTVSSCSTILSHRNVPLGCSKIITEKINKRCTQ